MKPKTKDSYFERISKVVDFLRDQVDNAPSLETMAQVASISPFHFHRVYRAVTGETPSGTLRRLRLAKACALLRDPDNTVTEIAFEVGYDSPQSFAKAFRAGTGSRPSEIRKNSVSLEKILRQLSEPQAPTNSHQEIVVKVVSLEPFNVIATRHTGPPESLFQAFGSLFDWAVSAGHETKIQGIYGVPIDDARDTPTSQCRFDCCFDFGPDVSGGGEFGDLVLGGGPYAVVRHLGPYDRMEEKYDYLFGTWISESDNSLRDGPVFNHYLQDPDTVPPEQWETDLYVPIQPRTES